MARSPGEVRATDGIVRRIDGRLADAKHEIRVLEDTRAALVGGRRKPGPKPGRRKKAVFTPARFAELDTHLATRRSQ